LLTQSHTFSQRESERKAAHKSTAGKYDLRVKGLAWSDYLGLAKELLAIPESLES